MPPIPPEDAVHVLDASEAGELHQIQRGATIRSASAGAVSALVAAGGIWLAETYAPVGDTATTGEQISHYSIALGITAIAAIFEVAFLYWDALRSAVLMARAAGLSILDPEQDSTRRSLARAALELENPARPFRGIDPLREASKWRLLVYSLLYKGKIAATSFLLKALIRRALGRVAVRGALLELIAVPVTAIWNGVVTWLVMRETRLRIIGPSAAAAITSELFESHAPNSPQREAAFRAIGSAIVRSGDLHPNLVALLDEVVKQGDVVDLENVGDTEAFIASYRTSSPDDQRWILTVTTLAAVIDGKLNDAERKLLKAMRAESKHPASLRQVDILGRRLRRGERITVEDLVSSSIG
ncbi:MAG: hypothetical protein ACI9OJ_001286 [Myxococcota bacterium]|jgi:hypothetical protein